jgi:uncharacterized membrane protein YfcA
MFVLLIVLGLLVGILSGLLGIGGGTILVPALSALLPDVGIDPSLSMHVALGTSMGCSTLTLAASMLIRHRNGFVRYSLFYPLLIGMIFGAIWGPYAASFVQASVLRMVFAVNLTLLGIYMVFPDRIRSHRALPSVPASVVAGFVIGVLASFTGLTGAVYVVPYLLWYAVPMAQAVGTGALCGFPISLAAMCMYVMVGWNEAGLPQYAVGYVYLPVMLVVGLSGIVAAHWSVKRAHLIPQAQLRRLFGVVLFLIAIDLVVTR